MSKQKRKEKNDIQNEKKSCSECWTIFLERIKSGIRSCFSNDLYSIFITLILSSILQLAVIGVKETIFAGKLLNLAELFISITELKNILSLLNIVMITLLVWCVTGIVKLLKNQNTGIRKTLISSLIFIFFVVGVLLYAASQVLEITGINIFIYFICSSILFILLFIFFRNPKESDARNEFDKNNQIA